MITLRNTPLMSSVVGACLSCALITSASAQVLPIAHNYCFKVGEVDTENYVYLKLTVPKIGPWNLYETALVYGVERGSSAGDSYVNQLSGAVTVAPCNDPEHDSELLFQVALTGNGYGVKTGGEPEIWSTEYNLQLAPSLSGKIYGSITESKVLVDGQPFEILQSYAIVKDVEPMPCDLF